MFSMIAPKAGTALVSTWEFQRGKEPPETPAGMANFLGMATRFLYAISITEIFYPDILEDRGVGKD